MSAVGPCQPGESRTDYIRRVLAAAHPLTDDDAAELAPLLMLGRRRPSPDGLACRKPPGDGPHAA